MLIIINKRRGKCDIKRIHFREQRFFSAPASLPLPVNYGSLTFTFFFFRSQEVTLHMKHIVSWAGMSTLGFLNKCSAVGCSWERDLCPMYNLRREPFVVEDNQAALVEYIYNASMCMWQDRLGALDFKVTSHAH